MRPIDEIARTAIELLQHGDQGARLIGDVTVGEVLAVMTFAAGVHKRLAAADAAKQDQVSEALWYLDKGYVGKDL